MPKEPFRTIARAPMTGGEMELVQRGDEFVLRVGGQQLMSSRMHGSEDALADLACKAIAKTKDARVLIGGLGMGYTLAAALQRLGSLASVVVAELVPAVIEWNRGALGQVAGHPLRDPRASVHEGDVLDVILSRPHAWDAILLDVDNGPEPLTQSANRRLYAVKGLRAAFQALRPGGVLAVWSAGADDAFTRRLISAGFEVEARPVRERGAQGGRRHVIWLGKGRPT